MRVFGLAIALGLGLAGTVCARAADLPLRPAPDRNVGLHYQAIGRHIAPLVIYDYEPGVIVRAWWLAPWRHRHYYPATGERPRVGRLENAHARREPVEPAETYYRTWTTTSAFVPERPAAAPAREDAPEAEPRTEPPLK
jgi:hypothetical protein